MPGAEAEDLLRELAPQVLGALVRRYGNFDTAQDAVQEALLAAATQWPTDGVPDNPRGWLITVASRRLTDLLRSEQARRRREDTVARWTPPSEWLAEGVALITGALPHGPTGPYQLQAAIAAVHGEAPSADATDWPQILALYELLMRIFSNPVVALNHAVAVAMVHGPHAALDLLPALESDERIASGHRLHAVRGHLLELAGDQPAARAAYTEAARRTANIPQQRYLNARAARLPAP